MLKLTLRPQERVRITHPDGTEWFLFLGEIGRGRAEVLFDAP